MSKEKSYWISSGKFSLFERLSMLIFGVFTFYLLVRVLDKEEYGTWMLFISIATLLDTARNGFFKNPLIRFIGTTDQEEKLRLQSSSFTLNVIYSLFAGAILALISGPLSASWQTPQLVVVFYVYLITNVFLAVFFHCEYVQRAHFRFKGPFIGYFLKSGLLFGFVVYFYFSNTTVSLLMLSICHSFSVLVATIVLFFLTKKLLAFKFRLDKKWLRQLFAYGKYTLGTNISAVLLRNVDTWMLGWYISPAAVAIYNVAIRVANLFEVPSMALASILFPQAVKKAAEEGERAVKQLYEKSVALILLLTLPFVVVVIIFSRDIVVLLAGEEYEGAGVILNVTMLYGLIIPFNKQMGVILDAVGKAKKNMLFVARNAVINVILNATFIPYFGIIGAAYATFSTFVIVMIINQIYLNRNFDIQMKALLGYVRYFFFEILSKVRSKMGV